MTTRETYEAPKLTVVGTVEELTESELTGNAPDGTFTHLETIHLPRVSPVNDR
jgi:hypothetical protein